MHAGIVSNGEPGLMSSKASTKYNPRSASGNDDVLDQAGREGTSSVAVSGQARDVSRWPLSLKLPTRELKPQTLHP